MKTVLEAILLNNKSGLIPGAEQERERFEMQKESTGPSPVAHDLF